MHPPVYSTSSKPFHIYTGARDTKLGAVITQDDKHIAFYSRKRLIVPRRDILLVIKNYCLL
jgi:hypothetical protein